MNEEMNEVFNTTGTPDEAADILADLSLQMLQMGLLSGKRVTVSCSVNGEVVSTTEGDIKTLADAIKFADGLFASVKVIPDGTIEASPSITIRGYLGGEEVFDFTVSRSTDQRVTH